MKMCIACGMPMKNPKDFAMEDETKDYCVHCANPDGTMQSYEVKLDNLSSFIGKTQGLDQQVAKNMDKINVSNSF